MITAEKSSVIEFQHAFFKQGKAHLLENIKRKVWSMHVFTLPFSLRKEAYLEEVWGCQTLYRQQIPLEPRLCVVNSL